MVAAICCRTTKDSIRSSLLANNGTEEDIHIPAGPTEPITNLWSDSGAVSEEHAALSTAIARFNDPLMGISASKDPDAMSSSEPIKKNCGGTERSPIVSANVFGCQNTEPR